MDATPSGARICPQCGTESEAEYRFCPSCAFDFLPAPAACPLCGIPRHETFRYCPNCAFDYAPQPAPATDFASQFRRPPPAGKPGRFAGLPAKFQAIGTLAGRPLAEIVAVVGPPNAVTGIAPGLKVLQWIQGGYHIVLLFDGADICGGVQSETSV